MDWREIKRCQGRRRRHRVTASGCDVAIESLERDVETAVGQPAQRRSRVAPAELRRFGAGAPDSTLIEAFLAPVARPESWPSVFSRFSPLLTVAELANGTLFPQTDSWYMGANVPGKARVFTPYLGGVGVYRETCENIARERLRGLRADLLSPVLTTIETPDRGPTLMQEFVGGDLRVYAAQGNHRRGTVLNRPSSRRETYDFDISPT